MDLLQVDVKVEQDAILLEQNGILFYLDRGTRWNLVLHTRGNKMESCFTYTGEQDAIFLEQNGILFYLDRGTRWNLVLHARGTRWNLVLHGVAAVVCFVGEGVQEGDVSLKEVVGGG